MGDSAERRDAAAPDGAAPLDDAARESRPDRDGAAARSAADGGGSEAAEGEPARPAAGDPAGADALPNGDVYDWYHRGLELLASGNAAAAAQLLEHAATAEPTSRSVREALARAQFDAGWYAAARDNFAWIIEENPADDYAQFGLGLSAARTGDLHRAVEHLALAVAMRPDLGHYGTALRGARAALSRR